MAHATKRDLCGSDMDDCPLDPLSCADIHLCGEIQGAKCLSINSSMKRCWTRHVILQITTAETTRRVEETGSRSCEPVRDRTRCCADNWRQLLCKTPCAKFSFWEHPLYECDGFHVRNSDFHAGNERASISVNTLSREALSVADELGLRPRTFHLRGHERCS